MQLINMVLAIAPFILLLMLNPVRPDLTHLDLEQALKTGLKFSPMEKNLPLDDENSTDSDFGINPVDNERIRIHRQKLRLSYQLFQHLIEITTFRRNVTNILTETLDLIERTKSSLENPSREQQGMFADAKITDTSALADSEVREKVSKEYKKTINELQTLKIKVYAWCKEVQLEAEQAIGMTPIIDQFSRSELKAEMPSDDENEDSSESYAEENDNENKDSLETDANEMSSESDANENEDEENLTPDEEWEKLLNVTYMEIDKSRRKLLKENSKDDDDLGRFLKMKIMTNNEYKELLNDKNINSDGEAVESEIYVESVLSKETEFPRWILAQKDIEQIQSEYLQWMEIFERSDVAQIESLKETVEESGQSIKQFCKTLAEYNNIQQIIKDCESTRDMECIEIMEGVLDQAHFKEFDQIYSTWRTNAGLGSNDGIRF